MTDAFDAMFEQYLIDASRAQAHPEEAMTVCYTCECLVVVSAMYDELVCQECHENTFDTHENFLHG